MIKTVLVGNNKIDILELIKEEATEDTGIITKEAITKEGRLLVVMYEKYFLRINSDLNVTIFYEEKEDCTEIELIASGGSTGLIRMSFGAEDKALESLVDKLKSQGFEVKA